MRLSNKICAFLCAGVCAVGHAAAAQAPQPPHGGQLVRSVPSDPKTFNDIVASETSSSVVTSLLFEGLTTLDPFTLQVLPNIAERWDVSADGLQWTFHLRRDVHFFDGVPLTADDVVFTFTDLIYNPNIPSSSKDVFTVEGKAFKVTKIDDHTVLFTLPVKFAPFLRSLSQAILPKHKLVSVVQAGKFPFTWGIDTPPQEIVGTGPFYLQEYRPGERLVFRRNPLYWKKGPAGESLPYLDSVIYLIIPDADAALLKFMDGELDFVPVRGMDYPLLKPLEIRKNFKIYNNGASDSSNFLSFNQNPRTNPKTGKPIVDPIKLAWFTDINFRRAVAHAMDKDRIIEIVFNGFGVPQTGPMSPSSGFFYNPRVPAYAYDLKESERLLTASGFKRRSDGALVDGKGHRVEFNMAVNTGVVEREQTAYMLRSDLQKLGIAVNIQVMEFNTLVSKLMATQDWDAVMIGLTGGSEPHFGQNVWASSGQLHVWNPKQEKPNTPWEKRLDEIYAQGVQELDENKRKLLYDEAQVLVARELPFIYTVLATNLVAVRERFGNIKPSPFAGALHNLEEIYVKND